MIINDALKFVDLHVSVKWPCIVRSSPLLYMHVSSKQSLYTYCLHYAGTAVVLTICSPSILVGLFSLRVYEHVYRLKFFREEKGGGACRWCMYAS